MDISHINLNGSQIQSITGDSSTLCVTFSRAIIIKRMAGSRERTCWWQAGVLVVTGVEGPLECPSGPLICAGGDVDENVYTYRDMLPIPFASRGHIRCVLRFVGQAEPLVVEGTSARLDLEGVPKYLEHLRTEPGPQ
jgi:hypothetical protein